MMKEFSFLGDGNVNTTATIETAGERSPIAKTKGTFDFRLSVRIATVKFDRALHVSKFLHNLMSVAQSSDGGHTLLLDDN